VNFALLRISMSVDFIAVTSLLSQSSTAPWQWKSTVSGTYSSPSLEYIPMAVLVGTGGAAGSLGSASVVNSSLAMLSKQSPRCFCTAWGSCPNDSRSSRAALERK
jgi:hypothetical protein